MPDSNRAIRIALQNLTRDDWDKLRASLATRRFARKSGSRNTDEFLHEAIKKLINGKRHCPLESVPLITCLFQIVRSLASHSIPDWKVYDSEIETFVGFHRLARCV